MSDLGLTIPGRGPRGETTDERGQPIVVPFVGVDPLYVAPYDAYSDLGRDFNGKPLVGERHDWLDRAGIEDGGERDFYLQMWRALDAEKAEVDEERDEAAEARRREQQR